MKLLVGLIFMANFVWAREIYKEPGEDGVYIIDNDIPVYHLSVLAEIKYRDRSKLIVNTLLGGVYDLWEINTAQSLSYCISDNFGKHKDQVIRAMDEATNAWMNSSNIKFIYRPDQDSNCDAKNDNVIFDIRPVSRRPYLARAFFPSTPRTYRNILIDSSSFAMDHDAVIGILKHELGHTLGFRHEHIHKDAGGVCEEDNDFNPLTEYDSYSVMHYPQCNGKGNIAKLDLTETDREGALIAYPY